MTGTEFAAAQAAATSELRACAASISGWLLEFLKIALCGWLMVFGVWLLTKTAGCRFAVRLAFIAMLFFSQAILSQSLPANQQLSRDIVSGRGAGEFAEDNGSTGRVDSTLIVTPKSKRTALTYSLSMTAIPVVAGGLLALAGASDNNNGMTLFGLASGVAGVIFGPGAGHAYAGRTGHFFGGAAIRASAGFVVFAAGASIALNDGMGALGSYKDGYSSSSSDTGPKVLIGCAGAVFMTSAIYDFATVSRAVDKYNHSNSSVGIRIEPGYIARYGAPALIVSIHF